jgi:hypothetical protein
VAGDLRSALVWWITSEVHSTAGNRQRRREVGYHGRLGKRGRGTGAHSEAKEWYVSSLRSTIEDSGSPFAGELHYLWASRGNETGAADANGVNPTPRPAIQRYRGAYWATIHQSTETTPSMACPRRTLTLLASWWSLERKLSSAFHQLLGEIAVMQSQELPALVHVSSSDGLTTSAPLIQVAWRSAAVQNQVLC